MKILSTSASLLLISSCAMPEVVETQKTTDEMLCCTELSQEISQCEKAHAEVQKRKGITGTNVAATLFFWPALIATHSNVNTATAALNERKNHLLDLYRSKGCSSEAAETEE